MKIILAGCSGFIGQSLICQLKQDNNDLVLLTRNPEKIQSQFDKGIKAVKWDGKNQGDWASELEAADALINLSGESIASKRWTPDQKKLILSSRTETTQALVDAIRKSNSKPRVMINASAVGFYGPVSDGDVTESSLAGKGFLAETCVQWEQTALPVQELGVRLVLLRIGVVLGENGGALQKMVPPFLFFVGGPLGSGKQWFPWIHREDVVGIIHHALTNDSVSGALNVTAPNPVTMKELCSTLGSVLRRPSWAPVPAFMLKLLLGDMSEMLLTGQRAVPEKTQKSGYSFKYSNIKDALIAILSK